MLLHTVKRHLMVESSKVRPDLTNRLEGVLTRLHEEPIALMADVEALYHKLKVPPDNVVALRFLWYPVYDRKYAL